MKDRRLKQIDIINKYDWDLLIILDACRYDYFFEAWKRHLQNDIMFYKANSEAGNTPNWLKKHWDSGPYPYTYVSANPFINSTGAECGGYNAKKNFDNIHDLWKNVDNVGRVNPMYVTDYVINNLYPSDYDNRVIVHYLQPHAPYLFPNEKQRLRQFLLKHVSLNKLMKLRDLAPASTKKNMKLEYRYAEKYSLTDIRYAYFSNLMDASLAVMKLLNYIKLLDMKAIVTSDHGEYLGENGKFGHKDDNSQILTTVPVMVVT